MLLKGSTLRVPSPGESDRFVQHIRGLVRLVPEFLYIESGVGAHNSRSDPHLSHTSQRVPARARPYVMHAQPADERELVPALPSLRYPLHALSHPVLWQVHRQVMPGSRMNGV